jgi:HlyD family secretion protein
MLSGSRLGLLVFVLAAAHCSAIPEKAAPPAEPAAPAVRNPSERTLRLVGIIEAVRAYSVTVPRLRGQNPGIPLVITRLARGGSQAKQGDVMAELDSQEQDRVARDRRSTVQNLDEQIRKMQADQVATRARDDTELTVATSDVERARLTVTTNRLLPQLEAEKNSLVLEQAEARLGELRKTYELKRRAAAADLRILEIRRARAGQELAYAEQNVGLMIMSAPFAGLVVPKTTFRNGQMVEIIEGDEARAGMPIVDVVDTSLMRARVRVNQGDIGALRVGQPARIYLDAYPELAFDGRIEQIAPVAVTSSLTPSVRTFAAVVSISGGHEKLMPDLTAAVEIKTVVERTANRLEP